MTTTAPARTWRLGRTGRRAALITHIASAGAWLGMDVVMGIAVLTAVTTPSAGTAALCLRALELFAVWPLLTAGLVCLLSGVLLGLGTKYGLVRYWWVLVKLVLNLVLCTLVLLLLRPTVLEKAEAARRWTATGAGDLSPGDLVFPPIVSTTALLVAVTLSVAKPWGRVRRSPGVG